MDNNGNFYIGGDYIFSMVFGHSVLPGPPGEALMIAKFRYDSFGCLQFNHYPPSIVSSINPQKQEITIYPNPTNYKLTIESDAIFPEGSKAEIYDITGRLISSYSLTGKSTVIAVAGYASGMYQCRIISGNGNVVVKKLVIMK